MLAELRVVSLVAQAAGDDDVTADVRRIMSKPAYRYEPTLFERIGRRLSEWLQRLLENLNVPGVGAGTFGGGAGTVVAWVLIVLALALAVYAVVRAVQRRVRKVPADDTPTTTTDVEHERRAKDWADEDTRMEREGRFKDAVRARYRELVSKSWQRCVDEERQRVGDVERVEQLQRR
jgi:uncharacterized membrane protein